MKRGIIFIFTVLLLISFVSAIDTEIKIYTLSNHTLNLQFLNPLPPPISFESITNNSGETGEFSYVFSNNAETFDLSVFLMNENERVLHERFNGIISGKTVLLTFIPGIVEIDKDYQEPSIEEVEEINVSVENQTLEVNETQNQTNDTINEVEEEKEEKTSWSFQGFSRLIGFSISDEESFFPTKIFSYWMGAFLFLIVLFFVSKPIRRKLKDSYNAKKKNIKEKEETLEEAKRELKEMQKKVDDLKEQKDDKIKIVKQKLIEDEKELMRLRREEKEEKEDKEKEE